ncbi:MAG: VirB3 family type IV secretion system protein [Succinivibrio sp.]|nr:VirB3 family type IV secretion system protein [Succinivibrio sp.]
MAAKVSCPSSLQLHSSFMGCDRELGMFFTLICATLAAWLFQSGALHSLALLPMWCAGMALMRYLNHQDPLYFRVRLRLGRYASPYYLSGSELSHEP